MTEFIRIEKAAPVSRIVWLIVSVAAAVAGNYLLLAVTTKTGHFLIAAICSIPLSYVFAILGEKLREFSMPDGFYAHGMIDCLREKLFWRIGPQITGIMLGQIVAWLIFYFLF